MIKHSGGSEKIELNFGWLGIREKRCVERERLNLHEGKSHMNSFRKKLSYIELCIVFPGRGWRGELLFQLKKKLLYLKTPVLKWHYIYYLPRNVNIRHSKIHYRHNAKSDPVLRNTDHKTL